MAVTTRTLRLQRQLNAELRKITDARTRSLVSAWVDAWDEIQPDLTALLLDMLTAGENITRAQLLRSARLRQALTVIGRNIEELAAQAGVTITGDLQAVIATAGAAQASIIDSQLPPGFMSPDVLAAWSRIDNLQIAAIVERSTQQITARTYALSVEAQQAVARELIRGVAAGSNPKVTARRIVQRVEGRFNGGLTRALNIARTETLDAHRAGAALGQSMHTDVLDGWIWLSALDRRTCPSCFAQHGTEHPAWMPGPSDHPQGRCARCPRAKSWRDLGIDIDEPPSLVPDASAVFGALSVADQRAILGPRRYEAWSRGEFPMDQWSVLRPNPGWRDSYQAAPAPSRGARRAVA